jgi:hypothetical protein
MILVSRKGKPLLRKVGRDFVTTQEGRRTGESRVYFTIPPDGRYAGNLAVAQDWVDDHTFTGSEDFTIERKEEPHAQENPEPT